MEQRIAGRARVLREVSDRKQSTCLHLFKLLFVIGYYILAETVALRKGWKSDCDYILAALLSTFYIFPALFPKFA